MYGCGSYDKSIGIYDEREKSILSILYGHKGGITNLQFTSDGIYLFSGARKDPYIHCWDLRKQEIVFSLERNVDTNQKISFQIDPFYQKFLFTGENGGIKIYNLQNTQEYHKIQMSKSK